MDGNEGFKFGKKGGTGLQISPAHLGLQYRLGDVEVA